MSKDTPKVEPPKDSTPLGTYLDDDGVEREAITGLRTSQPPKDYIDESGYIDPKDLENVTLPKPVKGKIEFQSTPPKDEVRDKINALKRNDNMIFYTDTVKGRQTCRDDLWAISTEELDNLAATIKLQQEALLSKVQETLLKEPSDDENYYDTVKSTINKLRLEL